MFYYVTCPYTIQYILLTTVIKNVRNKYVQFPYIFHIIQYTTEVYSEHRQTSNRVFCENI